MTIYSEAFENIKSSLLDDRLDSLRTTDVFSFPVQAIYQGRGLSFQGIAKVSRDAASGHLISELELVSRWDNPPQNPVQTILKSNEHLVWSSVTKFLDRENQQIPFVDSKQMVYYLGRLFSDPKYDAHVSVLTAFVKAFHNASVRSEGRRAQVMRAAASPRNNSQAYPQSAAATKIYRQTGV